MQRMVLRFGQSKAEDVATLIARKNYSKAIEVIREQLKTQRADARLRLQLGDVLALAGRDKDAVQVLAPLADEFAREGFAAKAVAILKKIQKLDPGRRDVDAKLAALIEQKQRHATVVLPLVPPPPARGSFEIGMEEIGVEPLAAEPVSVDVEATPAAPTLASPSVPADDGSLALAQEGAELDLGLATEPAFDLAPLVAPPQPAVNAAQAEVRSAPPPAPVAHDSASRSAATVLDQDLFTEDPDLLIEPDDDAFPFVDATLVEPEPASAPTLVEPEPDPMSDNAFAAELLSLVDDAFKGIPGGEDGVPMPDHDVGSPEGGSQIVVSPLFKDFSVDEMVAVIQGLKLLAFEPRQIILKEGQPGDSMYMLTAGTAKAYVRRADGKQTLVGELHEGAFFGEVAVLTGQPRSATVVAATHCELLELDRATLDGITARHPHVRDVLEEFAHERLARRG
jgi:Cyclic nucleotide-binding domain